MVEDAKTLSISRSTADRHQAQARSFRFDVRLGDSSVSTPPDAGACSRCQRGALLGNELTADLRTSVITGVLRSTTPSGNLLLPFPIPNDPQLQEQIVTAFFAAIDAGSAFPLPVVRSNGLSLQALRRRGSLA